MKKRQWLKKWLSAVLVATMILCLTQNGAAEKRQRQQRYHQENGYIPVW